MSFTNTKRFYKNPEIIKRFDFIEVFNACESMESNEKAAKLAYKYRKSREIGERRTIVRTV